MDGAFPPVGEAGRLRRWGGAGLLVAPRADLRGVPRLSPAERRVAGALPAGRRAEWLAGRLLAKRLVGELVGAPPERVEVLPGPDGAPYVLVGGVPQARVHVSVSHTARYVAAAAAPVPVGVDLCETASAAAVCRVADHVFTARERALIGAAPDRDANTDTGLPGGAGAAVLAGAWALKEAAVKADRSSVFGSAPRRIPLHGLWPPRLGGGRRAMLWRAGEAVLALVVVPEGPEGPEEGPDRPGAPGARAGRAPVGALRSAGSCLSVDLLAVQVPRGGDGNGTTEGEMIGDGATSHPSR